jgi:hypothetical protein
MIAAISSGRGDLGREFISSTIACAARSAPLSVAVAECTGFMSASVLDIWVSRWSGSRNPA